MLVAAAIAGTAVYGASCDLSKLTPVGVGENSFIYAADGSVLGAIPAERNRTPVAAGKINPWMAKATVAIEDRRFYQHGGIDPIGIVRAVVADVRAGKIVEGGSTITQELVRNLYLTRERTLKRKLIEACLAIKLANHWSKQRILTAYMNEVYYGNHAYGIEAAAETYYSIPASKLNLEQSATLAGLPQAPSIYDPFHQPGDALARRNEVLHAMLVNGAITSSQYATAVRDKNLHLHAGRRYTHIREPYFFSYVEDLLQQEYGANTVRSGGLKVYTTINPALQRAARAAITHVLNLPTDPASAIVSIDPRNGAIRAMAAVTPGRTGNQFNFATSARRQPGSTFKTVALTTAVALGMNPFTTDYLSAPLHYQPDPLCNPSDPGCAWNVQTYEHTYAGVESVEAATLQSDNTVYARICARRRPAEHRRHGAAARRAQLAAGSRSVDRARLDRRHPDRDGVGLRDARGGRRVLEADGDHEGRASERQDRHRRRLGTAAARARHPRLGGVDRDAGARAEHAVRHRNGRAPLRPYRRGQDRERPTTTRTRGSPATRRGSRRPSGSATRTARSRCSTCTASPCRARRSPRRSGTSTWRPPSASGPTCRSRRR